MYYLLCITLCNNFIGNNKNKGRIFLLQKNYILVYFLSYNYDMCYQI